MPGTRLASYRSKRDFRQTTESRGTLPVATSQRLRFVIQKHAARRLHYDLRLELGGVFKSWAVTRGPSLDPADKRLAVQVEDHPLDCGDFEGTIARGQYGGGTVQLWDRGYWRPLPGTSPEAALKAGQLKFDYSRDHRFDCVQVVIALIFTPQGFPLAYEVLAGNTADNTTLKDFLARIEHQYGKARRTWLMDRGIPTEEVLAQMRTSEPPVQYLLGTPKGRMSTLERALLDKPWVSARPQVRVKLLAQDQELYVFAESRDRIACSGCGSA